MHAMALNDDLLRLRREFVESLASRSKLTAQRYDESVRLLEKSRLPVEDEGTLEWFHHFLKGRGYRANTILTHLSGVRSYLRFLIRHQALPDGYNLERATWRLRAVQPMSQRKAPTIPEARVFEEMYRLLRSRLNRSKRTKYQRIALRDLALYLLLFDTGMRREEIVSLRRDQLAEKILIAGKGERERVVFLSPRAIEACRRYLRSRDDDLDALFVSHSRGIAPLSPKALNPIVRSWSPHLHPHMFRHAFARRLINRGVQLPIIQDLLGHASPVTTKQIYAVFDHAVLAESVQLAWSK